MLTFVATIALALTSALVQLMMRGLSRPNPAGRNIALDRDDALFWSDWIVAAAVALVGSAMVATQDAEGVSFALLMAAVVTLVVGFMAIPFALRVWAHDPSTGQFKSGWRWAIIANLLGLIFLLAAVAVGIKIYDFE